MQISDTDKKYLKYGAIAVGLFIAYKVIVPNTDTSSSAYDPTGNGTNGVPNPSYTFNAATVAKKLKDAMKEMGTDEDAIVAALTPVSQSQFGQVVAAFGNTAYNPTSGNQYFLWWATPTYYQLPFWLKNELSTTRYNALAQKYPSYL